MDGLADGSSDGGLVAEPLPTEAAERHGPHPPLQDGSTDPDRRFGSVIEIPPGYARSHTSVVSGPTLHFEQALPLGCLVPISLTRWSEGSMYWRSLLEVCGVAGGQGDELNPLAVARERPSHCRGRTRIQHLQLCKIGC